MRRLAQCGASSVSAKEHHVHQGSTCQSLEIRICADPGVGVGVGGAGGVGVGVARLPLVAFELFVCGTDPALFR